MSNPTLDELVAFMKKHGIEKVDSITDEKSVLRHFRATSRAYKEERDKYKKQRDELINDIADIKRKAEAFDEIKVIINEKDVYDETIVLEVEDVVFFCETDISGGSSDGHN